MFFIYESITVFVSNNEDFWFGFNMLLKSNLLFFILFMVFIIIISSIVYSISKFLKVDWIYRIYLLLLSSGFIYTYIQGNYFSGKLPVLDGSPINWNSFKTESIISYLIIALIIILNLVLLKIKKEKYEKIISFICVAICFMLFTGLIPTLTSINDIPKEKGVYTSTTKDINKLSNNKNFLILLVDMLDSKTFDKVIKDTNSEDIFSDFTYFPDTLSAYPFTRESIPFILTGEWYEAESSFSDYYNEAFNNSKLFDKLKNDDFSINVYEQDLQWTDSKSLSINNIKAINYKINNISLFKQEVKYILFKYLPYSLKKYSKIETMDYLKCRNDKLNDNTAFKSNNREFYDVLDDIKLQNDNYFQFVHIDGGHSPWNLNANLEYIENGTYEDKMASAITVIDKYLDRIKKSGQYDNSVIIIMADHGNYNYEYIGRQNPSFYIKGLNETHEEMVISNKKVSYADLNESIYDDLLDGKKSDEILSEEDNNRIRRFIWYHDYDDMYEQTLDGHAWETEKLINTGNRYKR